MGLWGWAPPCTINSPRYYRFFLFDGGGEGMVLRGLAPLCPLTSSILPCALVRRWSGGYGPTGPGTLVPPPSPLIQYCCIPSF